MRNPGLHFSSSLRATVRPAGPAPTMSASTSSRRAVPSGRGSFGNFAQPRHVPCHLLNHERCCGDPGHEMVVVDPLGKKPVGDLEQIDLAGAEHVLGLHPLASSARDEASHHVRLAVDPSQTTIAAAAKARGAVGSMKLGTARERELVRRKQGESDWFASFGFDRLAVELETDRVPERRQTACHER